MSRPSHRPRPSLTGYTPASFTASRASYPTFLSLPETVRIHLACVGRGLLDAFRWDVVVRLVISDSEIRTNILKSLLLNIVSLAFIYTFDLLLFPLAQGRNGYVGWAYQVFWLLPVVGASLYLNSAWCSLIAKRTFTLQHGPRAGAATPSTYTGLLNALATSAYTGIMVVTSLAISFALGRVPTVGPAAAFVFMCWVDAYYCFEHVWIARGLSLSRRVRHLEERWAYYFAFGLPSTALCMLGSSIANAALFALVFPAYVIMAMHACPAPIDPFNPILPSQVQSYTSGALDLEIRHPHPLIPIRMPVFALVLFVNDWIVYALSLGSGGDAGTQRGLGPVVGGGGFSGLGRPSHRRMVSEVVESIEEGEAVELNSVSPSKSGATRTRMRVGGRKFD